MDDQTEIVAIDKRKNTSDKQLVTEKRLKQSIGECELETKKRDKKSQFLSINAYSRHKLLVNEYLLSYAGSTSKLNRDVSRDKSEHQILSDNHQFVWDDCDPLDTWGKRVAKKYYDRLFKEYCIADLTLYKQNKIGMRWRTEREVIDGKGQFVCGDKRCAQRNELKSWEVNFAYVEHSTQKNVLVKLRLCPNCSIKLNYRHKRKQVMPHTVCKLEDETPVECLNSPNLDDNTVNKPNCDETSGKGDCVDDSSSQIWSSSVKLPEEEKPIDDEFDDYLNDLLL